MNVKRETSVDVSDLRTVSDNIKRLAISVDGHPVKSPPHSLERAVMPAVQETTAMNTQLQLTSPPPVYSILSDAKVGFGDRYELLKEIGRGGFSTVYQCRDRSDGSIYAVKVGSSCQWYIIRIGSWIVLPCAIDNTLAFFEEALHTRTPFTY
jgi:serine/threonine protein kinase